MKEEIAQRIEAAIRHLQETEMFPSFDIPAIEVVRPKDDQFGDYTSNVALIVSKQAGKNPREIAEKIKEQLTTNGEQGDIFEKIEVAGPGHLNFHLSQRVLGEVLDEVIEKDGSFGSSDFGKGKRILMEFVSANPTGPIHLGNARGGPIGDSLALILKKSGYSVETEYYVNDYGNQVSVLGHSILKDELAQYRGDYIDELSLGLETSDLTSRDPLSVGVWAAGQIIEKHIKPVCERASIHFDNWFSEKSLHESGEVSAVLHLLKEKNLTYEKENAVWFKSTEFGDDKDRVLVKSDGETVTYTVPDFAYHKNKLERGFDTLINIQGADHHGQAAVVKRFVEDVLGKKDVVSLIMTQFVRIMKDGVEVKMSKRRGTYYALDDLIEEVGKDAVRFMFSLYAPTSHISFDINLALEHSEKNPVFYVQYAHARLASVLRKAEEEGMSVAGDSLLLVHEKERALLQELLHFSELIEETAKDYSVHRLPQFAMHLADKLHSFYAACRVIDTENKELSQARLKLVSGVRVVLAETLRLIGVSAPEKM